MKHEITYDKDDLIEVVPNHVRKEGFTPRGSAEPHGIDEDFFITIEIEKPVIKPVHEIRNQEIIDKHKESLSDLPKLDQEKKTPKINEGPGNFKLFEGHTDIHRKGKIEKEHEVKDSPEKEDNHTFYPAKETQFINAINSLKVGDVFTPKELLQLFVDPELKNGTSGTIYYTMCRYWDSGHLEKLEEYGKWKVKKHIEK